MLSTTSPKKKIPSSGSISARVLESFKSLEELRPQWEKLAQQNSVNTIFQSYEWNFSWWQSFSSDHNLYCIVITDETNGKSEVIGFAPLVIDSQKNLKFLGYDGSDYCDFLISKEHPEALYFIFQFLQKNKKLWGGILLENIHQDSEICNMNLQIAGNSLWLTPSIEAPSCHFTFTDEDQKFLQKKSIKRHFNYFNKNGDLQVLMFYNSDEIIPYLDAFYQQHIDRRNMTPYPSQFHDSKQKLFYKSLAENLSDKDWLNFTVIKFNEDILAFHFGFEYNKQFIWYKPTFNVSYFKKSPGEVLLKFLIEHCIDNKFSELDFTVGQESFKYRFSNKVRQNYELHGFRSQRGKTLFLAKKQTKKLIKKGLEKWGLR